MDAVTAQIIAQGATLLIQNAFTMLTVAGKSADEIDNIFAMEKAKFDARPPTSLPEPPQ